jgi:hypothetical protein
VLKKTCTTGVLALTAAAGALLTSSPASAQVPTGGGGCCFNNNEVFNDVPISVHNRNNNIAIARNNQVQRQDGFGRDGFGRDGFGRDGLVDGGFGFDDD